MITRFTVGAKDFLPVRIWGQNMRYDSNKHHRRSIRLKGFDYTREGAYFVTICTQNQACLFGEIVNGQMRLNDVGEVADICWRAIPERFPRVVLDAFVIMPNHVHGIIWIGPENRANVGAKIFSPLPPLPPRPSQRGASAFRSPSKTVGSIVRGFKIGVTKWVRANKNIYTVWQRNYYEHIIRNNTGLNRIRKYIADNPAHWDEDMENPIHHGKGHTP